MNAIVKPIKSHCFDHASEMVRKTQDLKIREMFFTASGIVVEYEDMAALEGESRNYRMTIQPID